MVQTHQPGEGVFKAILPEDIDWKPFPAFPPSVGAVVRCWSTVGAGPYVTRVKASSGAKLMPHKHPEDRIYTVMSGVFYMAWANISTAPRSRRTRPVVLLFCLAIHGTFTGQNRANTSQITAIGPLGMEYKEAEDDPRNEHIRNPD